MLEPQMQLAAVRAIYALDDLPADQGSRESLLEVLRQVDSIFDAYPTQLYWKADAGYFLSSEPILPRDYPARKKFIEFFGAEAVLQE